MYIAFTDKFRERRLMIFLQLLNKILQVKSTENRKNVDETGSGPHSLGKFISRLLFPYHTYQRHSIKSPYAMSSQNMITRATNRKSRDRNCSSMYWGVPGAAGGGRPSLMLNAVAKIPNGNAPIPNDIWNPPSPNPKPWKPPLLSGSGLCP